MMLSRLISRLDDARVILLAPFIIGDGGVF